MSKIKGVFPAKQQYVLVEMSDAQRLDSLTTLAFESVRCYATMVARPRSSEDYRRMKEVLVMLRDQLDIIDGQVTRLLDKQQGGN